MDIRNLRRSQTQEYVILGDFKIQNTFWNAFHIATERGNVEIMRFLLEDCRIDSSSVGRLGSDKYNTDRSINADYEAFPLFLAIAGNHMEAFKFLWQDHGYFWDETHIIACLKIVGKLVSENDESKFIKLLLESKTSSEIFSFLNIDAKVDFIKSIDNLGESLQPKCIKYMKNKPYKWAFLVYKAQEANKLQANELKEISTIAKDIEKDDMETLISDKRSATSKVDHMMKSFSQLENSNEKNFNLVKATTQKLISQESLKKYKAEDDDEGKILVPVNEVEKEDDESEGEGEGEDDKEESEDDGEMPEGEKFCTYAEKGKLDKIQKAMKHPDFVDLIRLSGLEKDITIGDSEYNTELWNPLLFAIFYNQIEVVKYFIEE